MTTMHRMCNTELSTIYIGKLLYMQICTAKLMAKFLRYTTQSASQKGNGKQLYEAHEPGSLIVLLLPD